MDRHEEACGETDHSVNVSFTPSQDDGPTIPEGWSFEGSLYEQALFDQFLRDEHEMGVGDYIRIFGVAATNAAHDLFEHNCGYHLDTWWNRRQLEQSGKVHKPGQEGDCTNTEVDPGVKRRRLTGKQKTPFGMYEEPQVEEPVLPPDTLFGVLCVAVTKRAREPAG